MTKSRRGFRPGSSPINPQSRDSGLSHRAPTACRLVSAELSRHNLSMLQMDNTNIRSIIFVHGLGSNPDTTWRARKPTTTPNVPEEALPDISERYVTWVSDFLPGDLLPATRRDVRMFFYNYDSYWKRDALYTRLSVLGNGLLEHISGEIRLSEEVSIDNGPGPGILFTNPVSGTSP